MFYYLNIFFIYSFLGFLFENVLVLISNSNFNSGILYGPWTFIYGIAVFVLMFLDRMLKKKELNLWLEVLIFYISASVLMTFLEFSGGILIERLFHRVYWDYTNMMFNFGRYICLEVSLFWGLFATFINYVVTPHIKKFVSKIPKIVTMTVLVLFVIDIISTMVN